MPNEKMLLRKLRKFYFFKTYCCNSYCAPCWYDFTKADMKNLKVAYNNSLRSLLGLPSHNNASGMLVNLNIPSFGELLGKYVYSFRNRLETGDNIIMQCIYLSQFLTPIWYISGFGGVIFCRRNYIIVLCIIRVGMI